jgi:hypothetical protein
MIHPPNAISKYAPDTGALWFVLALRDRKTDG